MTTERNIDGLVTTWLRAEATTGGASSRVLERTLHQVDGLAQERSVIPWRLPERQARRLGLAAAVIATLLALAGVAVYIGSHQAEQTQPAPSRVVPVATPVPVPAGLSAEVVDRGAADAAFGSLTWTTLQGDATNLPSESIVPTPDGFASLEPGIARAGSRLMVSVDGLSWSEAPLPVPATTGLHLVRSGDDFWIWAEEIRLWRSTDFRTWTEVDLGDFVPPAVQGFATRGYFETPITVGSNTVLPLRLQGRLALDELFDVDLKPTDVLALEGGYRDQVLGDVRNVVRVHKTPEGLDVGEDVVGSIRLSVVGSTITVLDASRDATLASLDTSAFGTDVSSVAENLNTNEPTRYPVGALVLADGAVREAGLPIDVSLAPLGDAVVAIEPDNTIWTSTDGLAWTSLGTPTLPAPIDDLGSDLNPIGDVDRELAAVIMVDGDGGAQHFEYWTSADGLHWDPIGVLPAGVAQVIPAGPGRYLAIGGDDLAVRSSTDTAEWAVVDGLDGFDRLTGEYGGKTLRSVVGDQVFVVEVAYNGERVLWVLGLEPTTP